MQIAKPFKFLQRLSDGSIPKEVRQYFEPKIGIDVEIGPNVVIESGYYKPTIISKGCKIGPNVVIGHDTFIGEHVIICAGAIIAGRVEIGPRAFIGIGAKILNRRRIGADSLIGAGAVVVKDVIDNEVVAGVPARRLRIKE